MLYSYVDYIIVNTVSANLIIFIHVTFNFQVLAVFLARRYRNQHDPHYPPARAIFPHNYQY